ncbi:hypothetical protein SAMN02910291_00121 [Desulfovibrio desulfuricans]|uniref:Uncharacterized protein n=3 Tax=Desulfovibrionaceae TaxID=194924 RepID=A0AA94HQ31_DESDE|nr:hypothetical protein SAMN02910291_00121 [Desulfovibrio desulfuricans]SPD35772.1 Hypothetical protein DSVG11_1675 [Desulfovibrio sp. G11]
MLGYIAVLVQKSSGKYAPEMRAANRPQCPEVLQEAGFAVCCVFVIPHLP